MSLHLDTVSYFCSNQSLLLFLNIPLTAQWRSNKYQVFSLLFDTTVTQNPYLLNFRRPCHGNVVSLLNKSIILNHASKFPNTSTVLHEKFFQFPNNSDLLHWRQAPLTINVVHRYYSQTGIPRSPLGQRKNTGQDNDHLIQIGQSRFSILVQFAMIKVLL